LEFRRVLFRSRNIAVTLFDLCKGILSVIADYNSSLRLSPAHYTRMREDFMQPIQAGFGVAELYFGVLDMAKTFRIRYFRQSRSLLASSILALTLVLNDGTTHVNAEENPVPREGKAKTAAASEESPIEKLGRMIAGTWAIDATSEPREVGKKVGKDVGKSVIRFGPGKLALIEDYQTHGDDGTRIALGIFWWDGKGNGYRTMFCEDRDPHGCSVFEGLGNWEGADWVFHTEFENKDKKKVRVKEVLTATSPSSFTATFYRSENDGPMKLDWIVKHSKTDAPLMLHSCHEDLHFLDSKDFPFC